MHPNLPVYEMLKNGKLSVESVEKLNPAKWKYPELTKQKEVSALGKYERHCEAIVFRAVSKNVFALLVRNCVPSLKQRIVIILSQG